MRTDLRPVPPRHRLERFAYALALVILAALVLDVVGIERVYFLSSSLSGRASGLADMPGVEAALTTFPATKSPKDVVIDKEPWRQQLIQVPSTLEEARRNDCPGFELGRHQVAQFSQDRHLWTNLFRLMKGTPGRFIDSGAAFPRTDSNTYMLDVCQGWTGVCVEGDPAKADLWRRVRENGLRRCELEPVCVSERR